MDPEITVLGLKYWFCQCLVWPAVRRFIPSGLQFSTCAMWLTKLFLSWLSVQPATLWDGATRERVHAKYLAEQGCCFVQAWWWVFFNEI